MTSSEPATKPRLKAELRAAALARRDAMTSRDRATAAGHLTVRALPVIEIALAEGFSPVSAFLPIRSEVDPRQLIHLLAGRGVPFGLPTVTFSGLVFRAWKPGDPLRAAGFGLSEPEQSAAELSPRLLLVPLAAFDRQGGRIGYGKGHYDRAIAVLSRRAAIRTIGLAFDCQEVDEVPMEAHDRGIDRIVTETSVHITKPDFLPPPVRIAAQARDVALQETTEPICDGSPDQQPPGRDAADP